MGGNAGPDTPGDFSGPDMKNKTILIYRPAGDRQDDVDPEDLPAGSGPGRAGFHSEEILPGKARIGFKVVDLQGQGKLKNKGPERSVGCGRLSAPASGKSPWNGTPVFPSIIPASAGPCRTPECAF